MGKPSNNNNSSLPPPLEALLLLETYNNHQTAAHSEQKSCLWNLSKARRQANRESLGLANSISALHVREEIYPRAVLLNNDVVAELVQEEDSKKSASILETGVWRIVDPIEHEAKQAAEVAVNDKENDKTMGGLRQRKGEKKNIDEKNEWSEEVEKDVSEEALLRKADPLSLVGGALPPRDLKTAQTNAQKALQAYIDAANVAAQILTLLNEQQSSK